MEECTLIFHFQLLVFHLLSPLQMKLYKLFFFLLLPAITLTAQTTPEEIAQAPEKSAGVHYAYPVHEIGGQTAPPAGYEPFYISHFGRHGSRYLISDTDYSRVLDLLKEARRSGALTALGEQTLEKLEKVWVEAEWRGGDLSAVGVRELKGIAYRTYNRFPAVFKGNAEVEARSTTVVRCVLSMDAFCEQLKELNPALEVSRDASIKYQRYLNHHTKEAIAYRSAPERREEYQQFEKGKIRPDRLVSSLFSDKKFVADKVDRRALMLDLFALAGNMQNVETPVSFYDLFEANELFDLWQLKNYRLYVNDANSALNGGLMFENTKPVLENILENSERYIRSGERGATLRFAHDGNIIPLALLLHLKDTYTSVADPAGFYKAWSDFKVAPMAGNIQLVFFRNKESGTVLVKFLFHEKETEVPVLRTDTFPYYDWKDVKAFYLSLLKK